jgi:hypothetical protein
MNIFTTIYTPLKKTCTLYANSVFGGLMSLHFFTVHASQLECCDMPDFFYGSCNIVDGYIWGSQIQCSGQHDLVEVGSHDEPLYRHSGAEG